MIVNQEGREPTEQEMKAIQRRAVAIFRNVYASPEQLNWAISVYPEGFADAFDLRPLQQVRQDQLSVLR